MLPNVKVSNMGDAISNQEIQHAEGDAESSRLPQIAEKSSLKQRAFRNASTVQFPQHDQELVHEASMSNPIRIDNNSGDLDYMSEV